MNKPSQKEIYFLIDTLRQSNFSAAKVHRIIFRAHGPIISLRRTQEIMKEYSDGDREQYSRAEGSGRPKTSLTDDNVKTIKEIIEDDPHLSCTRLEDMTKIPKSSVHRILTDVLKKSSVCAKWVPHLLSQDQKQSRVVECGNLLQAFQKRNAKRLIIITDEKWVYCRDVQAKENTRVWVDAGGDRPMVARRTISDRKFMWLMASNFEGKFYYEIMEDGGSVNADRYKIFLENALSFYAQQYAIERRLFLIMHDNARPHVANSVSQWLDDLYVVKVKQPAYSPDLNLMDRYIFRNFTSFRRGKNVSSPEEVKHLISNYLNSLTSEHLNNEMEKFLKHLQFVIDNEGSYIIVS